MNHDITHCSGTDVLFPTKDSVVHKTCPKRETCYRYKAYLDLRNYENNVVSMLFPDCCMTKDYNLYWEELKQPDWCEYPDATEPLFGCWSLLDGLVTSEEYCKNCDCYKRKEK